jgi:putative addiction module component (TIGR02574 family)
MMDSETDFVQPSIDGEIMSVVNDLLTQAMRLPKKDRAGLAFDLLQSLDGKAPVADTDWEEAWTKEIQNRCDERDRGKAKTHDIEEVIRSLRGTRSKRPSR